MPRTTHEVPACWNWPLKVWRSNVEVKALRAALTGDHAPSVDAAAEELLLQIQKGRCAICGRDGTDDRYSFRSRKLHRDHDHATGLMRGWLCSNCNTAEGRTIHPETRAGRYRQEHPAAILNLKINWYPARARHYHLPSADQLLALRRQLIQLFASEQRAVQPIYEAQALEHAIDAIAELAATYAPPTEPPGKRTIDRALQDESFAIAVRNLEQGIFAPRPSRAAKLDE